MSQGLIERLGLSHYRYDEEKSMFLLNESASTFSIKELLTILSLLEEEGVKCEVDKDSNIAVL